MSKNYVLYGELQLNMSQPSKDVGTMVKNIESGTKKSTKNVQSLGGAFGGLSKIIGAATAIGWAFEMQYVLRQMTVDVVRFGAALDHVRTGTEDMARSTGLALGDVSSDLREASDYTISLTEAMRQVNQSLLLGGGPTIVENLPELFEIARYNARAMGIDVERALESMVTGLGRVSPRWLDNLGVIIDTRKVYQGFADDAGILVGQMTEAEQRTALIGAIIEKYGALVSDAGESSRTAAEDIEALRVSYKDLAAVVGEAVLSIPAVQALFNTIIDAAQGTVSWTQKTEGQQSALEDFFALMAKGQNQFTSFGKAYHDTFNVGQGEGVQVVEQFIGSIIDSRRAFGEIRGDMDEIITSIAEGDIESGITHWRSFGKEVGLTSKEIKDGVTALRVYYGAWGEFGASAISVQNDYQGILQEQIKESNKAYETAGEKIRAYQNSLVGMGSSAVQSGASMGEVLEIIESFSNVADSLGSQTEFIFMSAAEQALYLANAEKLAKEQFDALTGVIAQSQMESSLQRMGEAAIRSNAAFEEVSAIIANANAAVEELRSDPEWINKSTFEQFSDMNKITADTQRQLDDLTDSPYEITLNTKGNALEFLEDVEGMLLRLSGDGLGIAGALDLQGQAEGFVVAMNQLRLPEDVKALLFAQEEGRLGNLADALVPPSAAELAREAKQAADEAKRAYEQWYDALKSDAETAVLSGLQVKKEDFLPGYEDAPLEAVRRLRDIVNKGLDSPWAEYFEIPPEVLAQGEDAVKRWASDLADRGADLRDINLIDKDAFLRELEELKLARQERANVISQLVQWAIDAGLADNEKEAQSLAKDYLGEPTADGLVEGLEDEMEDYKFAKFITSAMDTDLEKNVEKYKTSGRNIANAMFGGWEEQMNENIGGYQYSDPNDAPPDGGLPSQYNIPIGRGGPLR